MKWPIHVTSFRCDFVVAYQYISSNVFTVLHMQEFCDVISHETQFVQCYSLIWDVMKLTYVTINYTYCCGVPKGGLGGSTPLPKFRSFAKAEPNSQFRGIYLRNNLIRIWVSFICKLSGTLDYGAIVPRSPFSLPSILNWICWPPPPRKHSWVCHWRTAFG
jgi:hypothetical protein